MFKISLTDLINKCNASLYGSAKYDPLLDLLDVEAPMMHPVYARLMESLEQDRKQAKADARLFAYYQLAALELVAKVVLGLPVERLPLGHEALFDANVKDSRCYPAIVWASQFLAYVEGKEPFSVYDESTGAKLWSISDDSVKADDFYNHFSVTW